MTANCDMKNPGGGEILKFTHFVNCLNSQISISLAMGGRS